MRAGFTFAFLSVVSATTVSPSCTELPSGTFKTHIGFNKFVTLKTLTPKTMEIGTHVVPDPDDVMDEDDLIKWSNYQAMLDSVVEVSIEPDCSLTITDPESMDAWHRMILVLSDYLGMYVGTMSGVFGKYDAVSDSIFVGGGVELKKD